MLQSHSPLQGTLPMAVSPLKLSTPPKGTKLEAKPPNHSKHLSCFKSSPPLAQISILDQDFRDNSPGPN